MANCDQYRKIGFRYVYCLACTKEDHQIKMPWLPFTQIGVDAPQNRLRNVWD